MTDRPGSGGIPPRDRLAAVVREEALRSEAQAQVRADRARLADGWTRRFVVEGRRAEEYVRLYESIGYEVAVDPVRREQVAAECDDCTIAFLLEFRTIYTRRKEVSP